MYQAGTERLPAQSFVLCNLPPGVNRSQQDRQDSHPGSSAEDDGSDGDDQYPQLLGSTADDGRPDEPPEPWQLAFSEEQGEWYFWNTETNDVRWEPPEVE